MNLGVRMCTSLASFRGSLRDSSRLISAPSVWQSRLRSHSVAPVHDLLISKPLLLIKQSHVDLVLFSSCLQDVLSVDYLLPLPPLTLGVYDFRESGLIKLSLGLTVL